MPEATRTLLTKAQMAESIAALAKSILEAHGGAKEIALVGIFTRGVPLAKRLAAALLQSGVKVHFGTIDITHYRDDLSTFQMLADWYPGDSGFRLTGGAVINNNKITFTATGATVGTATNQTANAQIKLSDSPSPYLGFGYSSRPKFAKGLGFVFDAGIMFQDPKVTLTASGASAADIAAQRAKVEDAVKDLKNMPVLAFGISYSF